MLTVCEKVQFERPWYVYLQCNHNWSPTDDTLQLESRIRLSIGIQEWLIRLEQAVLALWKRLGY